MGKENSLALAQSYAISKLPGRKDKQFDVPPGRVGIVISENSAVQTFEPGQHALKATALQVGFVPAGPFNTRLKAANLLSRDDVLVDGSLLCAVEIFDVEQFFTQYVVPREVVYGNVIDLSPEAAWDILAPAVRRYQAEELLEGRQDPLYVDVRPGLEPTLNSLGLHLDFFHFASFLGSEDRLIAAEQALELEQRLQDVEVKTMLAEAKSKKQREDALRKLGLEHAGKVVLTPVGETNPPDDGSDAENDADGGEPVSLLSAILSWISGQLQLDDADGHFRINQLFQLKRKKEPEPRSRRGRRYPRFWWRRHVIWMIFVVMVAIVITKIVTHFAGGPDWSNRLEFNLIVWGAVAGILFDSMKKLFQKYDELQQAHWTEPGTTLVDDLVGQDRQQADALVRGQCNLDLQNAQNALNDLRSRVYQQGQEDNALEIRALEKEFARARELVMNPTQGVPPYVTNLKISNKMFDDLLDYDEGLLVRSSVLNDDVQKLMQESARGQFDLEILNQLRASLDALKFHFSNRSQALRTSEEQKKNL